MSSSNELYAPLASSEVVDVKDKNTNGEEPKKSKLSNQRVLQVTCASFFIFVVAEIIGAIAGKSWSLLGDASAMSVDVITYFCNMQAERIKAREGHISRNMKMILEVYVPSFSVIALLGVTAYVTVGAVHDLMYEPEDDDVNIYVMYGFAAANTVVDIVSVYMFYLKGKDAFYQDKIDHLPNAQESPEGEGVTNYSIGLHIHVHGTEKNLNMISAFTHVGGDSLRTISIFIAAALASLHVGAPYKCDAWAAVVVTITIVIMIIPLLREIYHAYHRINTTYDLPESVASPFQAQIM